jgi:hypothetical protein
MGSIPPKKPSEIARDVADDVAFDSGRLWRLEDLRKKARESCQTVESSAASLGLPDEGASALQRGLISKQVMKTAKGMDALPPNQEKPTPEQIETALEAFSIERWITLIDGLDQTGTAAFLAHIRRESDELKQRFGARKVGRIEERAIMRDIDHWLRDNRDKLVPISDPYWAGSWREQARHANRIVGKGHTATGRSIAELSSDSSIARRLTKRDEQTGREMKVDDREVKRWRERMERLPFEQYAADVEADDPEKRAAAFIDYYTTIRKKYQRKN